MTTSTRPVYVSSGALPERTLDKVLTRAAEWGITHLELSSGIDPHPNWETLTVAAGRHHRLLFHNYFPAPADPFVLNLAAPDPEIRRRSLDHCRTGLRLTAAHGGPFFSVHAGFAMQPAVTELGRPWREQAITERSDCLAHFIDALGRLTVEAERLGVDLLIENNVLAPFNHRPDRPCPLFCVEAEETVSIMRAVSGKRLGLLIDMGHLNVSARTLGFSRSSFLDIVSPWVRALHLSGNDGLEDSNRPFGADEWFMPELVRWPHIPVIIEAYRLRQAELAGMRTLLEGGLS